jgi:hypothetical protein
MMPMKTHLTVLVFAACVSAVAVAAPQPCPISYSQLSMPYKHDLGISTPTVELSFTNLTGKKIVKAKFGLIVLGPERNEVPYEHDLTFTAGADPGKIVSVTWDLEMDKVDIHRMGETLYLGSARFEDGSEWKDDGNENCKQEVYYGPK